ncbi:MAG: ISAzo13 family transposase [Polyangiaceae bacterium]
MDERMKRLWAGAEADAYGDGGIAAVERATGLSRTTIRAGRDELRAGARPEDVVHVRRPGGGRPRIEETSPQVVEVLESLVDPVTRGDPGSPLRWTSKSTRKLAEELLAQGHRVSPQKVGQLLHAAGYSLQATHKTLEGSAHPDRNAQFEFINARVEAHHSRGAPVISVDTKKKELIGDFKNAGREWQPKGEPVPVRVHDFIDKTLGKAIPYGIYDLAENAAWVSVGVDHDTPEFAVESIARWWRYMGKKVYPDATELLITADGGGSNGSRARLWKLELQRLADRTGLTIGVSHFPPGTSKWNKIEHRLFCHITENWRGRPLVDHETVVQLIGSVRTSSGLHVKAKLDTRYYAVGISVTDQDMDDLDIIRDSFHGDWNYTLRPRHCAQS